MATIVSPSGLMALRTEKKYIQAKMKEIEVFIRGYTERTEKSQVLNPINVMFSIRADFESVSLDINNKEQEEDPTKESAKISKFEKR